MSGSSADRIPISVAVADANFMACRLLGDRLSRYSDFAVAGCAVDEASLLCLVQSAKCDVALVSSDLQDGRLSGLAQIDKIRNVDPRVRVVVLFDRAEPHSVAEAMRAGARGVLSRSYFEPSTLRKCIRRVYEGQIWLNTRELQYVLDALAQTRQYRVVDAQNVNLLSKREEDVVRLLAEGLCNREIALELNLSESTIKNYLFHIFDKLGISNRVELVLYAVTHRKSVFPAVGAEHAKLSEHAGADL